MLIAGLIGKFQAHQSLPVLFPPNRQSGCFSELSAPARLMCIFWRFFASSQIRISQQVFIGKFHQPPISINHHLYHELRPWVFLTRTGCQYLLASEGPEQDYYACLFCSKGAPSYFGPVTRIPTTIDDIRSGCMLFNHWTSGAFSPLFHSLLMKVTQLYMIRSISLKLARISEKSCRTVSFSTL